jgi:isoleucyl-tRNA synthetase
MTDMTDKKDYRDTVFLPKTDFPMKAGLASKEPAILARWAEAGLYRQLREARAGRTRYILHDGPPYANGDIHMGHAMNKILKDIVVRMASLRGFDAPYVPGWDCHGLPIEWKIEESYRKRKLDKDEVPPREFRAECRAYADKWVRVQSEQFQRLGVMGEWDDPYLTMKFEAEAKIVEELLQFAEAGKLYRGAKPVMWSPVEKTALAEAEVEYEDIVSTQIDVAFEIVEAPAAPELVGAYAVIWTTTPWTIPVNQAIAYGEDIAYCLFEIKDGEFEAHPEMAWLAGKRFLVARELVPTFLKRLHPEFWDNSDCANYEYPSGWPLEGAVARHPMHKLGGFFARPRPFLAGDFVTTDQGTGLVHMAPDHGEEDFLLAREHGLSPEWVVQDDGRYRADWLWLGGHPWSVIDKKLNAPDGPICSDLREAGALLAASHNFEHSYPHSWRSKAKVIERATPQWFIPMDRGVESTGNTVRAEPVEALPFSAAAEEGKDSPSTSSGRTGGGSRTLRETALAAIEETNWVPARSKNRIRAMVEGRPDWVISRQRAWGVPIALYVDRKTGEYLKDPAVNSRIIRAFHEGGADAWFGADHQQMLGNGYALADYEPVTDILDVWFDSGSTHAYVIEARYGEGTRADIYVEGSDQHRGWFQSSLLESCGTRGVAPFKEVLTHGFALDRDMRKMSKSLGNVVDPLAIIRDNGADILRLWVASTDYFEDVRIGKEVLATTTDAYRKLRNTFRYLLGALAGFTDAEKVAPADMPELERWVLHRLAALDKELREAAEGYEFNRYTRALTAFAQDDLSAFFFDIRKDSLYCDAPGSTKRRACRTVLDTVFHALVRWLSPILCFTAEEVWSTRFPEAGSVHLLEWPEIDGGWIDEALGEKWDAVISVRQSVTAMIEPLRRNKELGSSLEATVSLTIQDESRLEAVQSIDFAEIAIVASADAHIGKTMNPVGVDPVVSITGSRKCGRCWRHRPEVPEDGELCSRCEEVIANV